MITAIQEREAHTDTGQSYEKPVLVIQGLVKAFGNRRAIDGLDLILERGSCLALLGPNGAGKTTTIRAILGLVRPTSGSIAVFGLDHNTNLAAIKARIGVVPQMDNLDPDLTVLENLLVYASYFRMDRSLARERAEELLDFLALRNRRDEIIQNLSGGQRRRILLARSLINRPELLILDEPTVGLDPQARFLIWERLLNLQAKGTTMLLTSHYMEEVSRLSSQVVIMEQGKKIASGSPDEIVSSMIGTEVIEMEASDLELERLREKLQGCHVSLEPVGNGKIFIYVHEECSEIRELLSSSRRLLKRPATLEDLFLRLTGRDLRES